MRKFSKWASTMPLRYKITKFNFIWSTLNAQGLVETELQLNKECAEFGGICSVKWIWFLDFQTGSITLMLHASSLGLNMGTGLPVVLQKQVPWVQVWYRTLAYHSTPHTCTTVSWVFMG